MRGGRWYNAWMRVSGCAIVVLLAASCGGGAGAARTETAVVSAPPVPPEPIDERARACKDAAAGLERGTRGLRAPEVSVLAGMHRLCTDDGWPAASVECFAQMHEGDFGRCAAGLPARARQRLFERIGGGAADRVAVASALARLSGLQVGIPECDRFVEAVAQVLVCDAIAIEVRAQLGAETANFWSLPKSGLPADAQLRMADVCDRSTAALAQQAADAGCAP